MRVLVLGGIRSGKSELAEQLLADADRVRYIATSADPGDDPSWTARLDAHRSRRPLSWSTEEASYSLPSLLRVADPDDVLLVDDLGGWLNTTFKDWSDPTSVSADIDDLVAAVRDCPAGRLVLVTAEVGLTVVPGTEAGRTFADANGVLNRKIAEVCDRVALVVAGQAAWLKSAISPGTGAEQVVLAGATVDDTPFAAAGVTAGAFVAGVDVGADMPDLAPGLDLPIPDDVVAAEAVKRLLTLDFASAGLGDLVPVVQFAAGTQARVDPRPWTAPRVLLLSGHHDGLYGAGDQPAETARRVEEARGGTGPIAMLAATAGASVRTVDCPPSGAAETDDVLTADEVDAALRLGWQLAADAADEGADLLVLAAASTGTVAAATAVVAVTTGGEPASLLPRVVGPDGFVDDDAWIRRCTAIRDTRHRIRSRARDPKSLLAMFGGGDLAVAAGVILGATARRTPVLIDGPLGVAAGLIARDFGAQTRHWLLLPDHGDNPTVKLAGDVLGVTPVTSLKLALGEGVTALTTLPLLNTALMLAAATPTRPEPPAPPVPVDDALDRDLIDAEIQRVIVDSPTAETPLVPPPSTE